MHTKYACLRQKTGPYLYTREEVLDQMDEFIKGYRA